MSIKGYVVRGTGRFSGRTLYCAPFLDDGEVHFTEGRQHAEHATLAAAIGAERHAHSSCRDVAIIAVAEDGTETPLPSYEEALAQLSRIMEATAGIGFTGPEDRATERADLLLASREAIARERDEVRATREAERKAWARLYRAAFDHRDATFAAEQEQPGAEKWLARTTTEEDAARRALLALGVDAEEHVESLPAWYVERTKDWPPDHPKPPPFDVAPWRDMGGGTWVRGCVAPSIVNAAEVTVVGNRRVVIHVYRPDGTALPTALPPAYALDPVDARALADVLLKGAGWPVLVCEREEALRAETRRS